MLQRSCYNNIMEKDDQIFLTINSNQEPVEYLLLPQPIRMIRAGHVNKEDIRDVVKTGFTVDELLFAKAILIEEDDIVVIIRVQLDHILKVVEQIVKRIS